MEADLHKSTVVREMRVLVVGGSGYLGQHLLQNLMESAETHYRVASTYHSNRPQSLLNAFPGLLSFPVDLRTDQGFDLVSNTFGQPNIIVNCAALSVPRACEANPNETTSINVPSSLVRWISSFKGSDTLLIHLSTDQVYEGTKSFYKEEDETNPVNVYGKSKLEGEKLIRSACSNFAILRSSIIFGPQPISPVTKSLPLEWIDRRLSNGEEIELFMDEYRCPVYVNDLVTIILALVRMWMLDSKKMQLVLNVGGPDRVSRVQMAEVVARVREYDMSLIKSVSALPVHCEMKSPADISMDITKLRETLHVSPTSVEDGVRLTLSYQTTS